MFLLGFVKMFVYIAIIVGAVVITDRAKSWRRIIITAPITFILIMIVENLFG